MNIFVAVENLLNYGISKNLINKEDIIYTRNKIFEILKIDNFEEVTITEEESLEKILKMILDYACENKIIEDTGTDRDLFDTKLMDTLLDKPSKVIERFWKEYRKSPESATEFYYELSQNSDYIRTYRIEKDKKWKVKTEYGDLDITINLSKPEKDPKEIAKLKNLKATDYPKCLLCKENEGYFGGLTKPARHNHRIIPISINNSDWFFQYSPYVYYNEHCIVFSGKHTPMKIEKSTFSKLLDFIEIFPHYFVGSNADLPIVGGSILSHDHFQGGNYCFPMAKESIENEFIINGFEDINFGIVRWPMSVIRITGKDPKRLVLLADKVLNNWKNYSDFENDIFSFTDNEPHNTITPIGRKSEGNFQLDLVLRNNITTSEHPMGLFHPHFECHNIKKENIGLIEVMGLAVLPSRLKAEMEILKDYILNNKNIDENEEIKKHKNWVKGFITNYELIDKSNIDEIIESEIGKVFLKVLEHAGVFKRNKKGKDGFIKFINTLNE